MRYAWVSIMEMVCEKVKFCWKRTQFVVKDKLGANVCIILFYHFQIFYFKIIFVCVCVEFVAMTLCGCNFCITTIILKLYISQPCTKDLIPPWRIYDVVGGGVCPPTSSGIKYSYNYRMGDISRISKLATTMGGENYNYSM